MTQSSMAVRLDKLHYHPGEILKGQTNWQCDFDPKKLIINLFWYTRGKGDEDLIILESTVLDKVRPQSYYDFACPLPEQPYSFVGELIALVWAVEVVIEPRGLSARQEFVLSPFDKEIFLADSLSNQESL